MVDTEMHLFGAVAVPICALDADGKIAIWNPAMEALTGKPSSEVLGKKAWAGFFTKRKATCLDEALESGSATEDDLTILGAPWKCSARPVLEGGETKGVVASFSRSQGTSACDLAQLATIRTAVSELAKGNLEATCAVDDTASESIKASAQAVVSLRDTLATLVKEMNHMSKEHDAGDIDVVMDAGKFQGAFSTMAAGVNNMVNGHIAVKKKAMACIAEFGKGNFEAPLDVFPGKKVFINTNIEALRTNVKEFISDMAHMSKQHDLGDIDVQIPEDRFAGSFKVMAAGVNTMVNGHIAVKKKAMACIAEFGKGNFEATLETFPGKKVFINTNIEGLRTNIKAFIGDMAHMSKQHDLGDIDVMIPEDRFTGSFKVMAGGVNSMVNGHILVKKKAMACIAEFAKGNFEAPLEVFPGKKVFINNNIEALRVNLKALIADADMLAKAAIDGKLATRADASKHQGDYRKIVAGVNETLDAVIGPLNVSANYVDLIAAGEIPAKITDKYNGDFNAIKNNLNTCIDVVNALVADAAMLAKAAVEGKLATRADASKHQGDYRKIVQGVNETLDAVIGPLNVSANYVDMIAKGNIPAKITDNYNGDFNTIKNNLNMCIDTVNALVADASMLAKAAVEGKLATRADASKHQGDYRKIVQGVNETLDAVIGPLNVSARYVDLIAKGNIPAKITDNYNGDFNTIKNNLNMCIDTVNALVADAMMLAKAAVEGKLATRADASKHQGDYRKIVQGVNETLDAVIGPLNVSANYVDLIAKGNIPAKITDNYNGDFNTIKNNLNTCIDTVNALVADAVMLAKAAVEGKLATRADAQKHQGDYRKIVQGVNETLDAVIGPLNVSARYVDLISKGDIPAKITDNYNGDFNAIKNNLNTCIDVVNALVADAVMLSKAAVDGKLATRADASKHQGDYRRIVQGVNDTLDAVVQPINDGMNVLEQLAARDLRARVTGEAAGDYARLKDAINKTGESLDEALGAVSEAVEQITSASQQIASGSQSVAQGASEQASALEETSSSMEEMSGMTQQNADNTQQAKILAENTKVAADKGAKAMTVMLDSMGKIRAASEGTAVIIKDINDIAFQTNLLALNAAVEAARAGDAGRGFAVVAEEVRNLAGRAKEAAKKTEELIKESVKLADGGQVVSNEVNGHLSEITGSVGKVTSIVAEIAEASKEQSRGIGQVNKALTEMDKVTQQNAANSEESSSAAEELASQAQELAEMIGRFSLSRALVQRAPKRKQLGPATHNGQSKSLGKPAAQKPNGVKAKHAKQDEFIPMEDDPDFAHF